MKLTQRIPSPWGRSAIVGGLLAAAAPFAFAMIFQLTSEPQHDDAQTWIYVAATLAIPACFAFGAIAGIAAFFIRGRAIRAGTVTLAERARRWAWGVSGALAGFACSELTDRQWPIIGGILIGIALIPAWMLVGASFALRVGRMTSPARAILGGCIGAGAAYGIVDMTAWIPDLPGSKIQFQWFAAGIASVIGIIVYLRMRRDRNAHLIG